MKRTLKHPSFVLHRDAVTYIAGNPGATRALVDRHQSGRLRARTTSVGSQKRKLDEDDHQIECLALLTELEPISTTGIVLDASDLAGDGHAGPGELDTSITNDKVGSTIHGILTATAGTEGAILVTGDLELTAKARAEGIGVLHWEPFIAFLLAT